MKNILAAASLGLALVTGLSTTGCTSSSTDDLVFGAESSALERALDGGRTFALEPKSDAGELVARGVFTEAYDTYSVDVSSGAADLALVDGALVLQHLTIHLAGLDYAIPSTTSRLDAMVLTLDAPTLLDATWDRTEVTAHAEVTLGVEWSMETDSGDVPLAPQTVKSIPIEIHVVEKDGALDLTAELEDAGGVLTVDHVLEVSAIDLALAGH